VPQNLLPKSKELEEPVMPALALPDTPSEDGGNPPDITSRFYKSGGTLSPQDPSYVIREADTLLANGLREGLFCYVLTSRQMGKSSLMTHVSTNLQSEGFSVAELDLTTIGQNLTLAEWYDGLIYEIGRRLRIKPLLNKCWLEHSELGPLHRFVTTLQEGLLNAVPGNIVIFIDEIEVVRSLKFSTDEFFAAIRECYNRRATDSEMRRLTFCLLGMATPPDLIRDTRMTPFNIGRRIELADFTPEEALPLARGLRSGNRDGEHLLNRVLYWTNGHPYLTQKMCEAVAADASARTSKDVDNLCRRLFLSPQARETEANLVPVREYILRTNQDRIAVLELYKKVWRGRPAPQFVASDPVANVVHLSGISRVTNGHLVVRNRIYNHVFSQAWVNGALPDAEQLRQRRAYRRGLARSASVFGVIAVVMTALAADAYRQRNLAQEREQYTKHLLAVTNASLGGQALSQHNASQVFDILERQPDTNLAHFEYGYLSHMTHLEQAMLRHPKEEVNNVAFNLKGDRLYTASGDGSIRIWNAQSGEHAGVISTAPGVDEAMCASPNGHWLAIAVTQNVKTSAGDKNVVDILIYSIHDNRILKRIRTNEDRIIQLAFSGDSQELAESCTTIEPASVVRIWDTRSWKINRTLPMKDLVYAAAFQPGSSLIATADRQTGISLWDTLTGKHIRTFEGQTSVVHALAFSQNGTKLASGAEDGTGVVWDVSTGMRLHKIVDEQHMQIFAVRFAPSSGELITAGDNATIKFWDLSSEEMSYAIHGHTGSIRDLAISSDNKWLATAAQDQTARVWDLSLRYKDFSNLSEIGYNPNGPILSGDAQFAAGIGANEKIKIWNRETGKAQCDLRMQDKPIVAITFVPGVDQVLILSNTDLTFYNQFTGEPIRSIPAKAAYAAALAMSADQAFVAIANSGDVPRIIEVATGRAIPTNIATRAPYRSLAFSPDGTRLAVGDSDGVITLCDSRTGQVKATIPGRHRGPVAAIAYSPDGSTLASASIYGVIRLFNLPMQRETLMLDGKHGTHGLRSLAFSKDGKVLAMVDDVGSIQTWQSDKN